MGTDTKRRVLITGGAGKLGRIAAQHLRETDRWDVIATDVVQTDGVHYADLTAPVEQWSHLATGVDCVVHCAGHRGPATSWDEAIALNLDLSMRLMLQARQSGIRRFVFISSNWVMAGHRFGSEPLSPGLTPEPINPYGMSKLAIERLGVSMAALGDFEFVALRVGMAVTDPGLSDRLTSTRRWSQHMFLSSRDFCNGVERALEAPLQGAVILNLMSDNPGMRWDIRRTIEAIGYRPEDGHTPDVSDALERAEMELSHLNEQRREYVRLLTAGSDVRLPGHESSANEV